MRQITVVLIGLAGLLGGCFPCPVCVTADIDGAIIDKVSNKPVSGAAISATKYPETDAQSDEGGRFFLKHKTDVMWMIFLTDRASVTHLQIEKDGYKTEGIDLFGFPACGPIEVTVELESNADD